ncbi:unnamed protein product [Euphydryas editha]|uniref:DUF5641 domain-containing protein n=1 Tax=Euphydryas editha TaxID=104508 RepID=A0AAU9UAL5_EUPED|nr:unnamed protein product [Euphydryas editha]
MSEERELMKKRGSFKGRLTTFINYLDALNIKTLNDSDATEIQLRLGKMESLYEQYDEVQTRLECITEDVHAQFSERSEFESKYYKYLAQAQSLLTKFNKDNNSISSNKSTRASNNKLVKLPTIRLPKFSGSYETWLEFHDTFTSLIHSNDDIDEINKFHYLRASLEGAAAVVIQSIEFSASNYLVAWQLLCDRFDNKRLLIQNHISALFNVEPIVKESSLTLKRLIDQLNKNLRALESLGEPVKHWDTLLIYIVSRKLDQKTFREWEEFKGREDKNNYIKFDDFIRFMRSRADLIETIELSRNNASSSFVKVPKLKSMVAQSPINSDTDFGTRICPKCKDASERAYGACVYVRSLNGKDHCMVRLLSAKSRVAPIKPTTIPRLELCGALVGARLYDKVINSLRAKISRVYCWTDSTIVLGWLQMLPCKLQPFVRNRVADILEKTDTCIWRHVPTSMNPADLISRGVNISTLHKLDLWWSGPEFLMEDSSHWPSQVKHSGLLPETRPDVSLGAVVDNVEAILNSRPLTPLSSDPADYTPLTPGHFLIGRPLTSIAQPNYQDHSTSHLTRFQRIEQLRQHFWTRWSKEYVAELQQRTKWRSCKDKVQLNSLVVIKEENLPPLKWKLGRIVAVHPGTDGVVRVADIQTSTGVLRRAFNRICPLPIMSSG